MLSLLRNARPAVPSAATDLAMAAGFAAHASVALELADSRAAEQRLILLEDRDRIAMDLHDHVIQELFAIGLSLEGAATQLGPDDRVGAAGASKRARTSTGRSGGSAPASSSSAAARSSADDGLRQRVLEVASELAGPLGFHPARRLRRAWSTWTCDDELLDDVIACVREALANVAKHARRQQRGWWTWR